MKARVEVRTRLERVMKERGMTVRDLAEPLGLSPATVWRLATGATTDVSLRVARAIAAELGLDVDDLWPATAVRKAVRP